MAEQEPKITFPKVPTSRDCSPSEFVEFVSIHRYYEIVPANNSGLDAELMFNYNDSELNSQPEDKPRSERPV